MPTITKELNDLADRIDKGIDSVKLNLYNDISRDIKEDLPVKFFDWDGSIVYAFTAEDFLKMSSFPKNPTREGWESRGWNWDFSDAKEYVKKYGILNVGQVYNPIDVGSEVKLIINIPEYGNLTVPLYYTQSIANGVGVDWGDGSEDSSFPNSGVSMVMHEYNSFGKYTITLYLKNEDCVFTLGNGNNLNVFGNKGPTSIYLEKAILGNCIKELGTRAFTSCMLLKEVILSNSITNISARAFSGCRSLEYVILPDSVTNIETYAFNNCYSLKSIIVPELVSIIGVNAFMNAFSLKTFVTNSNTMFGASSLSRMISLQNIIIPDNEVTSIVPSLFESCYSLKKIIIPDSISNSIYGRAFTGCSTLTDIFIYSKVPPQLPSDTAFVIEDYWPYRLTIYVPYSEDHSILEAYKAATNWSTYADQMVEMEPETEETESNP